MVIKIVKPSSRPAKDVRLSFAAEVWEQVEAISSKEGVETSEVIRQLLAHALKAYARKPRQVKAAE